MNTKKCYFGEKKLFVVVIVVFEYGTSPLFLPLVLQLDIDVLH